MHNGPAPLLGHVLEERQQKLHSSVVNEAQAGHVDVHTRRVNPQQTRELPAEQADHARVEATADRDLDDLRVGVDDRKCHARWLDDDRNLHAKSLPAGTIFPRTLFSFGFGPNGPEASSTARVYAKVVPSRAM